MNKSPYSVPRLLLGMLVLAALLAGGRPAGSCEEAAPTAAGATLGLQCGTPPPSDNRLVIDYLSDDIPVPHAFNVPSGTLGQNGEASFAVYLLAVDATYWDVLTSYLPRHDLRVKVRPAPGSRSVAGKVRLERSYYGGRLIFTPRHQARAERTAIIAISVRGIPESVEFMLTIPAAP